jgi:hypothetical protein
VAYEGYYSQPEHGHHLSMMREDEEEKKEHTQTPLVKKDMT